MTPFQEARVNQKQSLDQLLPGGITNTNALSNFITDHSDELPQSVLKNPRKAMSVSQIDSVLRQKDVDLFRIDDLPSYAKSYILPKVMNKQDIQSRKSSQVQRSPSKSTSAEYDKVTYSSASTANDAFKFAMLKASLDHDSNIQQSEGGLGNQPRRNTRSSFGNALEVPAGRFSPESGRTSRLSTSTTKTWKMGQRRKIRTTPLSPKKSLVPCEGPGSLKEYGEYLKSGGYVPLPVLDPEKGIEVGIYAQHAEAIFEEREEEEDQYFHASAENRVNLMFFQMISGH